MSEPEIARRCRSCGVSIRELAYFCPQCGIELAQPDSADKQKVKSQDNSATAQPLNSPITAPLVEESATVSDAPAIEAGKKPIDAAAPTQPLKPKPRETGSTAQPPSRPQSSQPREQPASGRVRDKIQRATTLARDVEGDVIHRVQKVREISTVVLDEAGYDPSLRFVLVAAVLFILFLIIVLLNKLIS